MTEEKNNSRMIFSCGGKGGVGKTTIISSIIDYLIHTKTPYRAYDLDMGNKNVGSLSRYGNGNIEKLQLSGENLDRVAEGALKTGIAVCDLPAGAEDTFRQWYLDIGYSLKGEGIGYTAVATVNALRASVSTLIDWANFLQDGVDYVVALNEAFGGKDNNFLIYREWDQTKKFRDAFQPVEVIFPARNELLQMQLEDRGITPLTYEYTNYKRGIDSILARNRIKNMRDCELRIWDEIKEYILT